MTADDLAKQMRVLQARLEHIRMIKTDFLDRQQGGLDITYHSQSGVMMVRARSVISPSSVVTLPSAFILDMLSSVERFTMTEIGVLKLRLELFIDHD